MDELETDPKPENKQALTTMPDSAIDSSKNSDERKLLVLQQLLQTNRKAYDLEPMSDEQMKLWVSDLWKYSLEQVAAGLSWCRRNAKYGHPKIADVVAAIEGAPEEKKQAEEAKARVAFDQAREIAGKFVECDVHGNYHLRPAHAAIKKYVAEDDPSDYIRYAKPIPIPSISSQLEQTIRLCGGWGRLKKLTDEQWPFYQKEFFGHYLAYNEVEKQRGLQLGDGEAKRLLDGLRQEVKRLAEKPA